MGLGTPELTSTPINLSTNSLSTNSSPVLCPDCSTPHESDGGNFCEICGYNFVSGDRGSAPFPNPVAISKATMIQPAIIAAPTATARWQAIISIDRSLASPESPPAPDRQPITIPLTNQTSTIGRTSQGRAIYPDIPLDFDEAVSSRHAILTLNPDDSLVLRDIGSSNGTMVNGKEIPTTIDIPIRSGDKITLGHWTKIEIVEN